MLLMNSMWREVSKEEKTTCQREKLQVKVIC